MLVNGRVKPEVAELQEKLSHFLRFPETLETIKNLLMYYEDPGTGMLIKGTLAYSCLSNFSPWQLLTARLSLISGFLFNGSNKSLNLKALITILIMILLLVFI